MCGGGVGGMCVIDSAYSEVNQQNSHVISELMLDQMWANEWCFSRHWSPLYSGSKVGHFLLKVCPLLLSISLPERSSAKWDTKMCFNSCERACVCLSEWRSDSRSASLILSTPWTVCHTPRSLIILPTCYQNTTKSGRRQIGFQTFRLNPAWFQFHQTVGEPEFLLAEIWGFVCRVPFRTISCDWVPVPPTCDNTCLTPERWKSPQDSTLSINVLLCSASFIRRREEGEWADAELPGLKQWHKRHGEGGVGMDGLNGGRNGRVVEGGLCESLIPRFHQRVQIWTHLLLHEACSQDPPLTSEEPEGSGGSRIEVKKHHQWERL